MKVATFPLDTHRIRRTLRTKTRSSSELDLLCHPWTVGRERKRERERGREKVVVKAKSVIMRSSGG